MWLASDICYICLRTDRKLKQLDVRLSNFHREFCNIPINLTPWYCYECEYLLKKIYNFKNKCVKAMDLLERWIKMEDIDRNPIAYLWTHLPVTLDYCTPNDRTNIIILTSHEENMGTNDATGQFSDVAVSNVQANNSTVDIIKLEIFEEQENDKLKDLIVFKDEETEFEKILLENDEQIIDDLKADNKDDHITENDMKEAHETNEDSESSSDDTLFKILENVKRRSNDRRITKKRTIDKTDKNPDEIVTKRVKSKLESEKDNTKRKKERKDCNFMSKEERNKKMRFRTRTKGLLTEMTNGFETNVENGKALKKPYSKERLIQEIETKFSNCGELITYDGTKIDKAFILNCLQDKATDYVMRQLYAAVYRKSHFKPKALKLFKCIQKKYQNVYDSVFDVEYLNTKEKMYEEFAKRKSYECYVKAEFKCEICYQGFKHEKQLQNHLKCHDKSTGDIECAVCKMRFKRRKALISHQNSHEAVYKCKLCPLVTYYRYSMANHYHWHKGVKYKCDQCNATFGSVSAHRTHMSYRHARAHACTRCGRAYNTRAGLRAHTTRYHANEPLDPDGSSAVKCDECSLTLSSWEAYNRHLRFTHKQKVQIGRPPGSTSTSFTRRPPTLPRKRPVMTCRVCDAVGDSVGWLQLHFAEQHPAVDRDGLYADKHTHLCDICGKSFCTIYTLRAHQNIHAGVRPYSCDVCGASFHRAMSLRQHTLVHQPASKPCPSCGKKFKTASNLNNHMRSHIGNRRFKCNICGKGFIHRNSVNEHVRGVHKNIRRVRKRGVPGGLQTTGSLENDRNDITTQDSVLPKNSMSST